MREVKLFPGSDGVENGASIYSAPGGFDVAANLYLVKIGRIQIG